MTVKNNNSVEPAVTCSAIIAEREEGEIMDVEVERNQSTLIWIANSTKKAINKTMGKDFKRTCQRCQHISLSIRRHKEHCRSHFLMFVRPCSVHSYNKEVVRKHQLKAEKEAAQSCCTRGILYTVDEELFTEWRQTTGVRLTKFPRRKDNGRSNANKKKASNRQVEVRRISTPPKDRPIVGYKRPAMTIYNSQATNKSVSSILVTDKRSKSATESVPSSPRADKHSRRADKWKRIAMRSLSALKQLRTTVVLQQQELSKTRRHLDEAIDLFSKED